MILYVLHRAWHHSDFRGCAYAWHRHAAQVVVGAARLANHKRYGPSRHCGELSPRIKLHVSLWRTARLNRSYLSGRMAVALSLPARFACARHHVCMLRLVPTSRGVAPRTMAR